MHKRMLRLRIGERLPAQVADHLSDAADVVVPVASVPGRSALNHVRLQCLSQDLDFFQKRSYLIFLGPSYLQKRGVTLSQ